MAKLNKDLAKKTDEQESGSFDALDPGPYICKLNAVKVSDKPGPSGAHYWTWEFEVAYGDHKGRRFWTNTSLSEKALFKLKEVFDAFGYTTDSDTDEMIGEKVKLIVTKTIQDQGANAGQFRNEVARVLPFDPADAEDDNADEPVGAGF